MIALLVAAVLTNTNPPEISTELVFEITAYTHTGYRTASGVWPAPGMAACPRRYEFGTRFHIPGVGTVVCTDRGGNIAGRRLDLFLPSRAEAVKWGRRILRVRVLPEIGPKTGGNGVFRADLPARHHRDTLDGSGAGERG